MVHAVGGLIRIIGITQVDDKWEVWTNRALGAHCDGSYNTRAEAERRAERVGATQVGTQWEWRLGMYQPTDYSPRPISQPDSGDVSERCKYF